MFCFYAKFSLIVKKQLFNRINIFVRTSHPMYCPLSDLNKTASQKTVKQYRQQEGSKQKTLKRNFFFFLLTPFIFNFTLVLGVKWIYTPLNLILKVTKGLCSISQNKRLRFKSIHMKSTPSCTLSIGRITYVFHSVVFFQN